MDRFGECAHTRDVRNDGVDRLQPAETVANLFLNGRVLGPDIETPRPKSIDELDLVEARAHPLEDVGDWAWRDAERRGQETHVNTGNLTSR